MYYTKRTTEDFIAIARSVHGNKYDYSESIYTGALNKILIICKSHGKFYQFASAHTRGHGCQKCCTDKLGKYSLKTKEKLIDQLIEVHGNTYDYSKVEYVSDKVKIIVGCRFHGDFLISPNNHRRGRGCPSCAKHGYRRNKPGTLYVIQTENLLKVGITNNAVKDRIRRINLSSNKNFNVIESHYFQDGQITYDLESYLLKYLRSNYKNPSEVFDGSTETFVDVDLNEFRNHLSKFNSPTKH